MSRLFGWDLPPGVTSRMIDEAYGGDGPCEVCGHAVDACVCPECPTCGSQGDPRCYAVHGLTPSPEQLAGREALDAAERAQAEADRAEAAYFANLNPDSEEN